MLKVEKKYPEYMFIAHSKSAFSKALTRTRDITYCPARLYRNLKTALKLLQNTLNYSTKSI